MKHEIIYTEHYALIVSGEQIKEGDWCFLKENHYVNGGFGKYNTKKAIGYGLHGTDFFKKVIAHRPLTDAPILKGVPLLPKFIQEDDAENAVMEFKELYGSLGATDYELSAFSKGYNKAKETYNLTLTKLLDLYIEETGYGMDMWSKEENQTMSTITKIIQSLQQPKRPKSILLETIYRVKSGTIQEHKDGLAGFEYYEPKTTTNSQGQTELVGTYFYE
jgi:hypothetical protein